MKEILIYHNDSNIRNVLHLLRPILEEKEIIGRVIPVSELAKICRNNKRRLPNRDYLTKELAYELKELAGGYDMFRFEDLDVLIFEDLDIDNQRRSYKVEFQYAISKERQYLNSLEQDSTQNV